MFRSKRRRDEENAIVLDPNAKSPENFVGSLFHGRKKKRDLEILDFDLVSRLVGESKDLVALAEGLRWKPDQLKDYLNKRFGKTYGSIKCEFLSRDGKLEPLLSDSKKLKEQGIEDKDLLSFLTAYYLETNKKTPVQQEVTVMQPPPLLPVPALLPSVEVVNDGLVTPLEGASSGVDYADEEWEASSLLGEINKVPFVYSRDEEEAMNEFVNSALSGSSP